MFSARKKKPQFSPFFSCRTGQRSHIEPLAHVLAHAFPRLKKHLIIALCLLLCLPSHDIQRALVLVLGQVSGEDLHLLQGGGHARAVLAALAVGEAEACK